MVLIGLFWAKYARRIFAIVSTTSIPYLAPVSPTEATVDPLSRGSRLDADHPESGVLIPCVFTACTLLYTTSSTLRRHFVSGPTLRVFRAEAALARRSRCDVNAQFAIFARYARRT